VGVGSFLELGVDAEARQVAARALLVVQFQHLFLGGAQPDITAGATLHGVRGFGSPWLDRRDPDSRQGSHKDRREHHRHVSH